MDIGRIAALKRTDVRGETATLDTEAIKRRLFDDPLVRARLTRDYGLSTYPPDAEALASALLQQLGQTPVENPLTKKYTNKDVFRAAVRALGSNSRAWAKFLGHEGQIAGLLGDYDPNQTHSAVQRGALRAKDLQPCLPGQTSAADARAILSWAQLLAETGDYYRFVCDLGMAFCRLAQDAHTRPLAKTDLLLCVAGYLGNTPSTQWKGERYLGSEGRRVPGARRKTPGMGYTLASEFLRNLGWPGFKPDRHIKRLFARWLPDGTRTVAKEALELAQLIGRDNKKLHCDLAHALLGIRVCPPGVLVSHVDNLVWLLGAYVEKKGKESDQIYLFLSAERHGASRAKVRSR